MASRVCRAFTRTLMTCSLKKPNVLIPCCQNGNYSDHGVTSVFSFRRDFHTTNNLGKEKTPRVSEDEQETKSKKTSVPQSFSEEFAPFQDRQRVIQDVIEEQWNPISQEFEQIPVKVKYERGKTGLFDLRELVDLLKEERAQDVCVIKIPKEMDYADHMIIVTARSPKHMYALATFVRRRVKSIVLKATDLLPKIEGSEGSQDWVALDLGNIILHIFVHEYRVLLALETLWTVGPQYDDLINQKDPEIVQLLNLFQ